MGLEHEGAQDMETGRKCAVCSVQCVSCTFECVMAKDPVLLSILISLETGGMGMLNDLTSVLRRRAWRTFLLRHPSTPLIPSTHETISA